MHSYKMLLVTLILSSTLPVSGSFLASQKMKTSSNTSIAIAPPGGPMVPACAESEAHIQALTKKVNKQLGALRGDHNWPTRKEIIRKAVEAGIHPDSLGDNRDNPLDETLLHGPDDKEKKEFLEFLLEHGANPNQTEIRGDPVFRFVKTPATAQLLWDHGGNATVQNHGAKLLQHAACPAEGLGYTPELITWYINKGVPVDSMHNGQTALHAVAHLSNGYSQDHNRVLKRIKILLQEGALLGLKILMREHCRNSYNTPQIIKEKIEHQQKDSQTSNEYIEIPRKQLALSAQIKETLITFSRYRKTGIIIDLEQVGIPKVLCTLIASYYIAQEPSYEELENMPLPLPSNAYQPSSSSWNGCPPLE